MQEKRIEFVKFSPADEKLFVNLAFEAELAKQLKLYPDVTPKMKQLLSQ